MVEHRQDHQGEQGGGKQTADHYHRQGPLHFRARPAGKQERGEPEDGHQGGHEHGPEAPLAALAHGFIHGEAAFPELVDLGDQHHAVQHRHPEEGDEAYRGGDAQIEAGE